MRVCERESGKQMEIANCGAIDIVSGKRRDAIFRSSTRAARPFQNCCKLEKRLSRPPPRQRVLKVPLASTPL